MCWTYFKAIGHSLQKFSSSQKTLVPPGFPSWLPACAKRCFASSVPSKKILCWANFCFRAHAFAQPCRHNQRSLSDGKMPTRYKHSIKVWMLQVGENEISLRKCSGGAAHLRALKGNIVCNISYLFKALCKVFMKDALPNVYQLFDMENLKIKYFRFSKLECCYRELPAVFLSVLLTQ